MNIPVLIGAFIGIIIMFLIMAAKQRKFKKIIKSIAEPIDYSAPYYYASAARYNKSGKYYDSFGALYLTGKKVCYKTSENSDPICFRIDECKVQAEADWKRLKWFSIATPAGEKHYFNSNVKSSSSTDSSETLKGLAAIMAKQGA
jgi:hypothetical protein